MYTKNEMNTINKAKAILASKLNQNSALTHPEVVKDFCQMSIAHLEHEVFGVLFLNNQHQLIEFIKMFRGTLASASVYPREVAKQALMLNAAAVIFTHNHPSGQCDPSQSDLQITGRLADALQLFDIRTLDHIVVGTGGAVSFAERGLL